MLWVRNISDMLEYLSCIDGLPSVPVMLSCCFLQCKGVQRCRRGWSAQQSGHRSEVGLKEPITHLVDPCSACMDHWVGVDQIHEKHLLARLLRQTTCCAYLGNKGLQQRI